MNRSWMPLCCLGVVFALAARTFADGVIRDGLGARSGGRGGTNIAFADNGVVLYDNPAGMVNVGGCGLADLGFDLLLTDLHYSDPDQGNGVDADDDPLPLAQASFIRKSCNRRWAYGLGLFCPAGFAAEYDMVGPPDFDGIRRYKSFGAMAKILPGLACRVTDRLSVGGTLGAGVSHMELEGPYFLQAPGPFQALPTIIDLQATGAALCWSLGAQYQLTRATTIGVAYQSETRFHLDGSARAEVSGLGFSAFDLGMDVTWPRSLGVGIKHRLCPCQSVSVDVIWFNWSKAFDQFDLHLSEPTDPDFASLLGPSFDERFPLDWRDSVSVRVGYERNLGRNRAIRLGYAYHRNPIPDRTLTPYIQTIVEHTLAAGYGCKWRDWYVDLAYQFMFGPDRVVTSSGLVGGDFDESRHEVRAHWLYLSLLRRF